MIRVYLDNDFNDIIGSLLRKNEDDTIRVYFCIDCEKHSLIRLAFAYGWNVIGDKPYIKGNVHGSQLTMERDVIKV